MSRTELTSQEAADRLSIRELIDAYAHCADSRDAKGQMALFAPDAHFVVFMGVGCKEPAQEYHKREDLAPVFANLNQYEATTHFNGQNTVRFLDANKAAGEAYCLAHHVSVDAAGKRSLMVASIRYLDSFARVNGAWWFTERKLMVDWIESRSLAA